MSYLLLQGDAGRIALPDRSVGLVLGSPPYLSQRTYLEDGRNLGIARDLDAWISWMLVVTTEALRVSRGAVVWVASGCTKDRNYQPACEGLMYRWFQQGGHGYRPCYWHRVGIAGSGGDQWFRADVEYAMCFKRPGKLPWTDNTACGHPPKWAPGGEMSHRVKDGDRRNQWGKHLNNKLDARLPDGTYSTSSKPSHYSPLTRKERGDIRREMVEAGLGKVAIHRDSSSWSLTDDRKVWNYVPPAIANPGNLLELADDEFPDNEFPPFIHTNTGGGQLGSQLAHENEAPYPEALAEFFIKSLCPPGESVLDCFSGSGTTAAVAHRLGRHGIGIDLRRSQCELGQRRIAAGMKPRSPLDPAPAREPLPGQLEFAFDAQETAR